jgi:hypothetical protein
VFEYESVSDDTARPIHFMKRRLFLAYLSIFASAIQAADEPTPTAEHVLSLVRRSYTQQDQKLIGYLRDDDTGRMEPLELTMTSNLMRFLFKSAPPEIIHLDLTTTPATLWQVKSGGSSKVPLQNAADPVRGMDFNYEDLSLRFIYWKNVSMLDANFALGMVNRVKCWKIRVVAPDEHGPYATVDLWVEKESGGVAKMEAFNDKGKMVKRFQVTHIHKGNGAPTLKAMRVESFDPENGKPKGRTYLNLDPPAK